LDTPSPLSDALGIRTQGSVSVQRAYFCPGPDPILRWNDAPKVSPVIAPEGALALYRDRSSGGALAVRYRRGRGTVIFFSAMFDPHSGYGLSRHPHLAKILRDQGISPPFSRTAVDAYFDAGYHFGDDLENLAAKWESWGIQAIHANIWDMYRTPPFDYRRLVEAAHRHGILVYAWLQWPYVGQGFWTDHPEWREKDAAGGDAHISFLYLMNFQNPDCLRKALADLQDLLVRVDFDGIDLAEFSIAGGVDQSLEGPSHPRNFVGLNDNARAEFEAIKGIDPLELFSRESPHYWKKSPQLLNDLYSYRRDATRKLTQTVLEQLSSFNSRIGNRLDLLMTIIDNTLHPEFDQLLALDLPETIRNTRRFGFRLQVEDPTEEWAKPPDRHLTMGSRYAALLGDRGFSIDINFEDCHPVDQVGYPTTIPIGSEMHWLWRYAAAAAARVCFYAESQIKDLDWETMPAAMAAGSGIRADDNGWEIDAPHTAFLRMSGRIPVELDGSPWPCRKDAQVMIPAGRHRLTILHSTSDNPDAGITLISTTGELVRCRGSSAGLDIVVQSYRRCLTRVKGKLGSVSIDGNEAHATQGGDGIWCLFTTPGRHAILAREIAASPSR